MKKYHFEPHTEADDIVAHYVSKGALGFTTDKDLFKGVKGIWYNCHYAHRCWVRTTKKEAEHFFKSQVLAGDSTDGIPSIAGEGLITAEKLMKKYGSSWDDILGIFKDKGYDKQYMITMTRLVCMSQWSPKKGIKLWKYPK
jgi:5'-3' exonuclease